MSDSLHQTPTSPPDDQSSNSGGWRTPQSRTIWQAPQTERETSGWSVPALPRDIEPDSEETGGWHLPKPDDTPFSPEDELIIARPEDALFELAASVDAELREAASSPSIAPEDALFALATEAQPAPEQPREFGAPEDILAMLERIDEEEVEPDTAFKSELFALASLAEAEAESTEILPGISAPTAIPVVPPADEADDDFDSQQLSPVERALRQRDSQLDPAEYARRQLEELDDDAGGGLSGSQPAARTSAGAIDPAEYARRQLEELDNGFTPVPSATAAMPRVNPRDEVLAERFRAVEQQVGTLRYMRQSGQITEEQFQQQLRDLMILDDDQVYWMMGAESDIWYKYVNDEWVMAVPPALTNTASAGSETLRFNQSLDSMPYTSTYADDVPLGTYSNMDDMPLPRRVPLVDPEGTMVGGSFNADFLTDDQATVVGPAYGEVTQPAQPVGYGAVAPDAVGIEPVISDAPPNVDEIADTPLYEEARLRQQRSFAQVAVLTGITVLGVAFLIGALGVFAALSWYNGIVTKYEEQIAGLQNYRPLFQTVRITDYLGNDIATLSRGGERIAVTLDQVNPLAIHAVIAQENPTFYSDPGWDVLDRIGAFTQSVTGGQPTVSRTITQRVVDELIVRGDPTITDLESAVIAGELTNRYSKDFILSLYLNEFSFGNQAFGIEAAAEFYFEKRAADLNGPEAALLAAIVASGAQVDPVVDREGAFRAARATRERMLALGCLATTTRGTICVTPNELRASDIARVEVRPFRPRQLDTAYPHFINLVRAQLEAAVPDLYSGGYVVRTTLVPTMQEELERRLREYIERSGVAQFGVTTGAAMWTDPQTGAIRAYIGSPDYNNADINGEFDHLRDYKSPGQLLYPMIHAAGLIGVDRNFNNVVDIDEYFTAASILWDVPSNFNGFSPPNPYQPNIFYGPVPLRQALVNTYPMATAKVFSSMGGERVTEIATAMGLRFPENATLDIRAVSGEAQVRLNDLMTAYGTIANGGRRIPVYAIESVTASGNAVPAVFPQLSREPVEAIPQTIAFLLQSIMTDDNARNRGIFPANSNLVINGRPTQNVIGAVAGAGRGNLDLWTIGFTNNAVVGIWLGNSQQQPIQSRANGFNAVAPLWNRMMTTVLNAMQTQQPSAFNPVPNIITVPVCPDTGIRTGGFCTRPDRQEYFAANRQPPGPEQGFTVELTVNTWTNQIATDACPNPEDRTVRTFANIPDPAAVAYLNSPQGRPFLPLFGLTAPLELAPTSSCDINTQTPLANITFPSQGQTVQNNIQITGQVSADARFDRYTLEYAPVGTENFRPIEGSPFRVQQPSPNSVLATWNTQQVPNGQYVLRLGVIARDGGFVFRRTQVNVDNPLPTATPTPTPMPPTPTAAPAFPTFDAGFTPLPFDDFGGGPTFTPDPF